MERRIHDGAFGRTACAATSGIGLAASVAPDFAPALAGSQTVAWRAVNPGYLLS